MKAGKLLHERHVVAEHAFVELLIWRVPQPVQGSLHRLKYSLALVMHGRCVMRYDNEAGKGDHRHADGAESAYPFSTFEQLLADFWKDVDKWLCR
jgi:Family of unknown function (DUF6516)